MNRMLITKSTAFWMMESIRLDLAYGIRVHPDSIHKPTGLRTHTSGP
ncbi:MAG TPA: hypothetical protein VIP57_04425 [Candidatus Dormibacteraeota bacterium]